MLKRGIGEDVETVVADERRRGVCDEAISVDLVV